MTDGFDSDLAPHDLAAEQGVLGSMLQSRSAISDVLEVLKGDDFYRPAHQIIFEVVATLHTKGEAADTITVYSTLVKRGEAQLAGGALYLHDLTHNVPSPASASHYADIVREQAVLRGLYYSSAKIRSYALNPSGEDADDLVFRAQSDLSAITSLRNRQDYQPLSAVLPGALDNMAALGARGGAVSGVPTGFSDLDSLTNGWQPGQVIVVAARPAVGKSTIGLDFIRSAAIVCNIPAAIFSLEMGRDEIIQRTLSAECRIPLHDIRAGRLTEGDYTKMAKRIADIGEAPLFIDDSANMSITEIQAKCGRLKDQHNLGLVMIDYLQLMGSPTKSESRQNDVSEISRSIKLMAKKLEVPVIAISQLNRGPEQRTDKKPLLSDLRESGSIEQDADMVILLSRPDYQEKEHPRAGEADLHVAKHRNGPTTTITVAFQGHYSRFVDMASPAKYHQPGS